ncbi:MAG TPA: hypothetical protein VNM38_08525 [Solirubrobacterales bacterium]|nr:hypothetical protein [Solirubrobacterales bacterium]
MNRLRAIGLIALVALGVTASVGAASAAASGFSASSYPATVNGARETTQSLKTSFGNTECKVDLSNGSLNSGSQTKLSLTPSGSCSAFGSWYPLKANGCKFELNADWSSYGIVGCEAMTIQLSTCLITIPAQRGLSAEYQNVVGSPTKVRFASTTSNLKYTTAATGCGGGGTSYGGQFLATWLLSATSGANLSVEVGGPTGLFEAEAYPVTYSGTQEEAAPLVFNTEGGSIQCKKATFTGSASGATSALALSPTYSECNAFGFTTSTVVTMNGCSYVYNASTMDISCPGENSISVTTAACTMSIPAQTGLSSVSYANTAAAGRQAISINHNITGLKYTITKDGFACPFGGTGTRTSGTYSGRTLLQGTDSAGVLEGIRH